MKRWRHLPTVRAHAEFARHRLVARLPFTGQHDAGALRQGRGQAARAHQREELSALVVADRQNILGPSGSHRASPFRENTRIHLDLCVKNFWDRTLVAGAIGGNAVGAAAKNYSLGTAGNSIGGAVGGVILGQILAAMGIGEPGIAATKGAAPAAGGLDIGALIGQLVGGGAGGAVLTLIIGVIKNMMQK
jgi:hypothetical protein